MSEIKKDNGSDDGRLGDVKTTVGKKRKRMESRRADGGDGGGCRIPPYKTVG